MGSKKRTKKLVLLDSHAILHRAYHALPDFTSGSGEPTGAIYGLVSLLLKLVKELEPDYVVACYDLPGGTFRHDAFEHYKAGREKTDDDLSMQIERSRDVLCAFGIPIYEKKGYEADDLLGTIVEQTSKIKDIEVIIASGDMDTLQLVDGKKVRVYTLRKGIKDTVIYDEDAVVERFGFKPELMPDYKGLRGDPSDNIPGITGIGEKTATDLIQQFGGVTDIYKALKKDKEAFLKKTKPRIVHLLEDGKEEAEFSRMLAEINKNVPVTFTLPKQTFISGIHTDEVLTLFQDLQFKTLTERFKAVFGVDAHKTATGLISEKNENVSEEVLYETGVALWVLSSEHTSPSLEDILSFSNTTSFTEARKYIFSELKKQKLLHVFENIEKPLIPVVREMEERGVLLDTTFLNSLSKQYHAELIKLEKKITKYAGEPFNINSPKQLGVVLYDTLDLAGGKRTATGQRSTRESELQKIKDEHPIIPLILSYRELGKLLSTYIDNLPKMTDSNSRLHAHFLQHGAATGRMASASPNLQNIPIRTDLGREIRKAFIAPQGYQLVTLDYSQIELRLAAILSGDPEMVAIFREGGDIHRSVAARVFGVAESIVSDEERRRAKTINFGILYGMGPLALSHATGSSMAEAKEFLMEYRKTFHVLNEFLEKTKRKAAKNGFTETMFGRRRYFPGITSKLPYIRAEAERMAINAPIQGTQADIIKIAMRKVYDEYIIDKYKGSVYMTMQIHDELVFEIRDDLVVDVATKIKHLMEGVLSKEEANNVPICVSVNRGRNWGELKAL